MDSKIFVLMETDKNNPIDSMLCQLMKMKNEQGANVYCPVPRRASSAANRPSECKKFLCIPEKIPSNTDIHVEVRPDGSKYGRIVTGGEDDCAPNVCPEATDVRVETRPDGSKYGRIVTSSACDNVPMIACPKGKSPCQAIPMCSKPPKGPCLYLPSNDCPKKDTFFKEYICKKRPPQYVKRGPYLTDAGIPEDCARHIPDKRLIKYVACKSRHNGLQDYCDPLSENALKACCKSMNNNY